MIQNRIIIRHVGPAGKGIPAGGSAGQILSKSSSGDFATHWVNPPSGTDAVSGPTSSTANNIALFYDSTGKAIKDSGVALSSLAMASSVAGKVDKVTGKGLSDSNYTAAEKAKLATLAGAFRGSFASLAAINAADFSPAPAAGDFCTIEENSEDIELVLWDNTNELWTVFSLDPVIMTAAQIATALFKTTDAETYSKELCRIFTHTDKSNLDLVVANLSEVLSLMPSFGSFHYFSLTGTDTVISAASDGLSNFVKVSAATTLSDDLSLFDSGASPTDNRLRYVGTVARAFKLTASISSGGVSVGDVLIFAVAKNGTAIPSSRIVEEVNSANDIVALTSSCIVTLTTNDYVEVFVANATDTSDPTIYNLTLNVVSV